MLMTERQKKRRGEKKIEWISPYSSTAAFQWSTSQWPHFPPWLFIYLLKSLWRFSLQITRRAILFYYGCLCLKRQTQATLSTKSITSPRVYGLIKTAWHHIHTVKPLFCPHLLIKNLLPMFSAFHWTNDKKNAASWTTVWVGKTDDNMDDFIMGTGQFQHTRYTVAYIQVVSFWHQAF